VAKQWKVGTAYVEISANVNIVNELKRQSPRINQQALMMGYAAGQSFAKGWRLGMGNLGPGPGGRGGGIFNSFNRQFNQFNQQNNQQNNLYNMLNVLRQTLNINNNQLNQWNITINKANQQQKQQQSWFEKATKATIAGLMALVSVGTVHSMLSAASPQTMSSIGADIQLTMARLGKHMLPFAGAFEQALQGLNERLADFNKGPMGGFVHGLARAGAAAILPRWLQPRQPLAPEMGMQPQFMGIHEAWKAAQMAGSFAQANPRAAQLLGEQMQNLADAITDLNRNVGAAGAPPLPREQDLAGAFGKGVLRSVFPFMGF
jgi:hypothetical protein